MLIVQGLGVSFGKTRVLSDVSFRLPEGDVMMVVGPNGSGKTTLARAVAHALPHEGKASVGGVDVAAMNAARRARSIAVLTQQNPAQYAYTAREVVSIGRYAHHTGLFSVWSKEDTAAVDRAMDVTGTRAFERRDVTTLSGGELQRVYLARALAQDPEVLILDEPTNHLDIEHQIATFEILGDWVARPGRAALAIVHDLNLAYAFGTSVLLLSGGRAIAQGAPGDVLSRENLQTAYHIDLVSWMRRSLGHWS